MKKQNFYNSYHLLKLSGENSVICVNSLKIIIIIISLFEIFRIGFHEGRITNMTDFAKEMNNDKYKFVPLISFSFTTFIPVNI